MHKEIEGTHKIGSQSLYTKSWIPDGPESTPSKAKLIFIHGFSDHINRYYELFPTLVSRGIEVHAFDQRGWGRSVTQPSEKGLTGPTSLVISDIVSFIKTHLPSPIPVFVLGHSMGGGEIITLASDPQYADLTDSIRGWLLEAPFIGFAKGYEPGFLSVFFGRLAGRFLPHRQMVNKPPPENLTRDPAVVKSINEDPLMHHTGTLEGLAGMLDRTAALNQGKTKLNPGVKSLWLGHGTDDKGTSFQASEKWFNEETGVKDKEFKRYDGWTHQLHADLPDNRHVYAKDVGDWILARCNGEEGGKGVQSKL